MACTSASAWFDGGHHRQVAGSIVSTISTFASPRKNRARASRASSESSNPAHRDAAVRHERVIVRVLDPSGIAFDIAADQGFGRFGDPVNERAELFVSHCARDTPHPLGVGWCACYGRTKAAMMEGSLDQRPRAAQETFANAGADYRSFAGPYRMGE